MPIDRKKDLKNKMYSDRLLALFHLSALGHDMVYHVSSEVVKLRFLSALGSNFICCAALGIKECSP